MKIVLSLTVTLAAVLLASPSSAQKSTSSPSGTSTAAVAGDQPTEAELMKQMMELAKPNENHKLLASLVGTWTFTTKIWMSPDPKVAPTESKGTAVRKAVMDGRYFTLEVTGTMPMTGPDGKVQDMEFKGMGTEGYDNVKKRFVGTWSDNMSTGIMMSEGTYDSASKTFTYIAEGQFVPGMPTRIREVIKVVDADHHIFEQYDNSRGAEAKTIEISYTRQK